MPSLLGKGGKSTNPQSGSHSSSSGDMNRAHGNSSSSSPSKGLPPLFYYMEAGDWARATERAKRHPREVKAWVNIRSKSEAQPNGATITSSKRLALHHACFKLRHSVYAPHNKTDPFIEVCRFILMLIEMHPEAASMRESRHGCLPLHLAAFASCTLPSAPRESDAIDAAPSLLSRSASSPTSKISMSSLTSALPGTRTSPSNLSRPVPLTNVLRSVSESTTDTMLTTMSAGMVEEQVTGIQTDYHRLTDTNLARNGSEFTINSNEAAAYSEAQTMAATVSVSMGNNILISEQREEWAVKVLNALLDAYPRGIRMDSEGGRLPLHTACAGRATPRVVSTLLTAYPAAARHRNKDGFLPLHLTAHWGISHPQVVISLLKAYPDATFGRNRWERTPLEEALCMAGENGRPHQAALVRSLRKHPSYWTRPEHLLTEGRGGRNSLVDIDDTVPSNDDESTEDSGEYATGAKGRLTVFGKGKNGEVEVIDMDLPSLIRSQNWEGALARLELNPQDAEKELTVTTRGGFTSAIGFMPLHYACERSPPVEVIEALIAACPRAVATRAMPGGALPLHVAATWYAPVEVVSILISVDRNACKTHDELGNLPLHSACFSGTSIKVIEALLRAYPKATLARNHQGSLPDEITKRLRHDDRKAILAMLAMCREQVLAKREQKYKNRSDGQMAGIIEHLPANPQNASGEQELMWV